MITSHAVFALHYSITGVSSRRHAATRDYAEALPPWGSWPSTCCLLGGRVEFRPSAIINPDQRPLTDPLRR